MRSQAFLVLSQELTSRPVSSRAFLLTSQELMDHKSS